jgi:hypothetical protein
MRSKFFAALALCAGLTAPLSAQTEITPFIGTMIPMTSLLADTGGNGGFRMQAHTIYGFRLTRPMSPSLGLELALGAGSGEMQVASTEVIDLKFAVWFADLRARLRVAGNDDTQLGIIAGAGWTQYSSGFFDAAHEADEDTKFAGTVTGIVGLGFRAKVTDRLIFSFDATDRIHEQGIDAAGLATDQYAKYLQHDATFTFGLTFPLGS